MAGSTRCVEGDGRVGALFWCTRGSSPKSQASWGCVRA